jgi:hypothetical protein
MLTLSFVVSDPTRICSIRFFDHLVCRHGMDCRGEPTVGTKDLLALTLATSRPAATENDLEILSRCSREMTSSTRAKPAGARSSTSCIAASGPKRRLRNVMSFPGLRSAS